MTQRNTGAAVLASPDLRQESGSARQESGFSIAWDRILKALWPTDTSKIFQQRTRTSRSFAERVIDGSRGLRAETFLDLCDAPDGDAALVKALRARGIDQPWVREIERNIERRDIRRRQDELRRQLERLDREGGG